MCTLIFTHAVLKGTHADARVELCQRQWKYETHLRHSPCPRVKIHMK